ncbi:hypothetical protein GCM10010415_29450 [Streptomyces atrovirens]
MPALLRDLFATVFFLAFGVSVGPADVLSMLPAVHAGAAPRRPAAGRYHAHRLRQLLRCRRQEPCLGVLVAACVLVVVVAGPVLTRCTGTSLAGRRTGLSAAGTSK